MTRSHPLPSTTASQSAVPCRNSVRTEDPVDAPVDMTTPTEFSENIVWRAGAKLKTSAVQHRWDGGISCWISERAAWKGRETFLRDPDFCPITEAPYPQPLNEFLAECKARGATVAYVKDETLRVIEEFIL